MNSALVTYICPLTPEYYGFKFHSSIVQIYTLLKSNNHSVCFHLISFSYFLRRQHCYLNICVSWILRLYPWLKFHTRLWNFSSFSDSLLLIYDLLSFLSMVNFFLSWNLILRKYVALSDSLCGSQNLFFRVLRLSISTSSIFRAPVPKKRNTPNSSNFCPISLTSFPRSFHINT